METQQSVSVKLPKAAVTALMGVKPESLTMSDKVVLAVAIDLFLRGDISIGKAAEMTGQSRIDFAKLLVDRGVCTVSYTEEDLAEDLQTLEWMRSQGRK